jgi:HSP20 family molecular chaperone IbpA
MFPWNFFPNNHDIKSKMNSIKPDQIDRFTQEMMGKMMPKHVQGMIDPQEMLKGFFSQSKNEQPEKSKTPVNISTFETHDYVYVRIEIEQNDWLKDIKVFYTGNQMIIEQIPKIEDRHTLPLPASVKKKGATACFKDGILEIKLTKSNQVQYSEIDVTGI